MENYKVLTNLFRDFDEGDILIKSPSFPDCYWKTNDAITDAHLPDEFVENYPEYFEKIQESSTINKIQKILEAAKDIEYWLLSRHEDKNVLINFNLK